MKEDWRYLGQYLVYLAVIALFLIYDNEIEAIYDGMSDFVGVSTGDTVKIASRRSEGAAVAENEEALERYRLLLEADDKFGIATMEEVRWTKNRTYAKVIDCNWTLCEIRLLDGDHEGFAGWVSRSELASTYRGEFESELRERP